MDIIIRIAASILGAFAVGFSLCSLAHCEDTHETEARAACRHILSPAMATAHQEYEKHLYWRCVELQRGVPWRLTTDQYQ